MDGGRFDRLAKSLATGLTRRRLLAAAAGVAFFHHKTARANQLTPSTCGAAGEVCTQLAGCCDGLSCATSAINVNYGVCIPGDGGTVSVGTSLISPFSEDVAQEVAALASDSAATGTTDTTSTTTTTTGTTTTTESRESRIAARKTAQDAKAATQKSKRQTHKTTVKNRKQAHNSRLAAQRGPRIDLQLLNPGGGAGSPETLRATNLDDRSVVLTKIESKLNPSENSSFERTVKPGNTFNFYSGPSSGPDGEGEFSWNSQPVCPGDPGAGIRVYGAFSLNSQSFQYVEYCDPAANATSSSGNRKKRKKSTGRQGGSSPNNKKK